MEKSWLTSFQLCLYYYADVHVWSAEKPKPDLPDCMLAMTMHVMFASQQSSDSRGVCLYCREIGMIYMRH